MRKHQQQQILELIQTIKQVQSGGMYAECQDSAIAIGRFIESIEGGETHTVTLLEEYHVLLFKASIGEADQVQLKKKLADVEKSVKNELKPNKIEIAFLSYNASMSDSIMSIYLDAKTDPDCDSYWIPIPFFERKKDGTLGKLRYEGAECYGGNIECTDWQQYDIESRHPDIIFTFAPYDGANYVTTINPNFYCERLRRFTDLLVYVPYFVSVDDVQEHFCTLAGCIYAHKVIVQSERVCDTYIRVFKKNYNNRFGRPEDKFIALGSPKYDEVINTKREDCVLPDEWRKLIGNKKVVLYNTTVGAILNGNGRYLQKLRDVFNEFRNRSDVALWWRPHPLSEVTISSMRPQLFDEYKEIVSDYLSESQNFIFDQSTDLHRAIATSDMYIGSMSSLVALYQVTGKPVFLTNLQSSLVLDTFIKVKDEFYFTSLYFNGLFKMKENSDEAELIGVFFGETSNYRLFSSIIRHKSKLIFIPSSAKSIHFYDLESGNFSNIKLDAYKRPTFKTVNYDEFNKFIYGYVMENILYLFPSTYPAIIKYSFETKIIEHIVAPINELSHSLQHTSNSYFIQGIEDAQSLLLWSVATNQLLEFNFTDCTFTEKYRIRSSGRYSQCIFDGNTYWLIPFHGKSKIIKLSADLIHSWEIDYPVGFVSGVGEDSKIGTFMYAVLIDNHIWMFPGTANYVIKISIDTNQLETVDDVDADYNRRLPFRFLFAKHIDGTLYVYNHAFFQLVEYDLVSGRTSKKSIAVSKDSISKNAKFKDAVKYKFESANNLSDFILTESATLPLDLILSMLVDDDVQLTNHQGKFNEKEKQSKSRTSGEVIYEYVKKLVMK